ncbi:MAG: PAS domain-containing protein [Anaerolineae bacterium]
MLSIIVFVIHVCVFGAVALYLHYRSEHYGLAPMLFFVAGVTGILNLVELITIYVEPAPGIIIRPGGHVYVPIILLVILILYVSSGTRTARIVITGVTGVNILVLSVLMFMLVYLNVRDTTTAVRGLFAETTILTPLFLRGVIASTVTFFVNMLAIIIVYQGIKNTFPDFPESVIPGIALLVALWIDSILYNILAFLGTPYFVPGIPGDVVMKTLAGLLLAPLAGWYLTRVAPRLTRFVGAADRPTLAILFGEDSFASRLLQLESELQVSRAIYEQIMHHIEEVFWLVDIEKERLLYVSPNFEKLTGKPPENFYRNPAALLELIHPDDRAGTVVEQVFLSPDTEFRIRLEDGSIRWLRNRSFPIMTPDEHIVRYAGITEDVTDRREAQAQAFALELSREKVKLLQRFVRDASHDLRAPLTSILLKLDMLPRANPARQQEIQTELRTVAQHLNSLIDDLFTLSRIEGEGQVVLAALDLSEIVRQACEDYRTLPRTQISTS